MTRDEAIKAMRNVSDPSSLSDRVWIERFVALGMLKIDEQRSANFRAREQFRNENIDSYMGEICLGAIERAGLKIVEK